MQKTDYKIVRMIFSELFSLYGDTFAFSGLIYKLCFEKFILDFIYLDKCIIF